LFKAYVLGRVRRKFLPRQVGRPAYAAPVRAIAAPAYADLAAE
jgi:hypothetical protein